MRWHSGWGKLGTCAGEIVGGTQQAWELPHKLGSQMSDGGEDVGLQAGMLVWCAGGLGLGTC